jgi:succinate dehydrogenase/fumarate reductase flavoprotein subunit
LTPLRNDFISLDNISGSGNIPLFWVHTLVIGSGASGLNAAVQLARNGIKDVMILTEGLSKGTSINTGSDKQTYYKLSISGQETDSPRMMAESYLTGGSMHGDLALVEASLSARAFLNLVELGVPFPRDQYGQFIGYKTDHDPRQRATSIGPYTSREMCRRLITEVNRLEIPVRQEREIIQLITIEDHGSRRIAGALALTVDGTLEAYATENVIFAVGGPGGIYKTSVYPAVQMGAIGLALMAGARACNLPESQYGLASILFRWNVSGSYMQVIPRFISRSADGISDEKEFLQPYFSSTGDLCGKIFLKGYQWPFDAHKVISGSSIIDLLVYIETVLKGRRVFLDFVRNPEGFSFDKLPIEAHNYLKRSNALQATPIERLFSMNPGAVELYQDHNIALTKEPLEIAVCAQHNNGGLAGNIWWESTNIKHLFPIGEVNGSHGVNRPGGSALNSGQVGGFRAAEFIANCYTSWSVDEHFLQKELENGCRDALQWILRSKDTAINWRDALNEIRARMSLAGANIRSEEVLNSETTKAWDLVQKVMDCGCRYTSKRELRQIFRVRQLCFTHAVYLGAILYGVQSGVGSRGSSIVLDRTGERIHPSLDEYWKIVAENPTFRSKILESEVGTEGLINKWVDCRPIPETDSWFETAWADFRNGNIYRTD